MAEASPVSLEGVRFSVHPASELDVATWRDIQMLERVAFSASFREHAKTGGVDNFVHWNDPDYFRESRINPQIAVERGDLNPGLFARPVATLARHEGKLVGYAYVADNTSGSPIQRQLKMLTPPGLPVPVVGGKRYAWERELAIDPKARRQGIAKVLSYLALETRHREQPLTAYVWPGLKQELWVKLHAEFDFNFRGSSRVDVFKDGSEPIHQNRLVGKVGFVLDKIMEDERAKHTIETAKALM